MVNTLIKKFNKLPISDKLSLLKTQPQYNGTEIFLSGLDKRKWFKFETTETYNLRESIDSFITKNNDNIIYLSLCKDLPKLIKRLTELNEFMNEIQNELYNIGDLKSFIDNYKKIKYG